MTTDSFCVLSNGSSLNSSGWFSHSTYSLSRGSVLLFEISSYFRGCLIQRPREEKKLSLTAQLQFYIKLSCHPICSFLFKKINKINKGQNKDVAFEPIIPSSEYLSHAFCPRYTKKPSGWWPCVRIKGRNCNKKEKLYKEIWLSASAGPEETKWKGRGEYKCLFVKLMSSLVFKRGRHNNPVPFSSRFLSCLGASWHPNELEQLSGLQNSSPRL